MAIPKDDPCDNCERIRVKGNCLGCPVYELELEINEIECQVGGRIRTVSNIIRDLMHPTIDVRQVIAGLNIKPDYKVNGHAVYSPASFQRIKAGVRSAESLTASN